MGFPTDDSLVVSSFPPVAVAEKQGKDTLNTSQQSLQDPCLPQDPTLTVWDVHCRSVRDRDRRSYGRRWPGRKESYKKHRRALSVPLVQPHGTIPHAAVAGHPTNLEVNAVGWSRAGGTEVVAAAAPRGQIQEGESLKVLWKLGAGVHQPREALMDGGEPRKKEGERWVSLRAPQWFSVLLGHLCPAPQDISATSNSSATRGDLHKKSTSTPATPITGNTNTSPVCLCN